MGVQRHRIISALGRVESRCGAVTVGPSQLWPPLSSGGVAIDEPCRVAPVFLFYACHRHYPGGIPGCSHRSLPHRQQPSPKYRRVGFRIPLFEACSTFTLITACILAGSPSDPLHRRLQPLLPVLLLRLLPAGAIVCRAGFAPAGRPCLRTAHGNISG
jgi:hypothetical protein